MFVIEAAEEFVDEDAFVDEVDVKVAALQLAARRYSRSSGEQIIVRTPCAAK